MYALTSRDKTARPTYDCGSAGGTPTPPPTLEGTAALHAAVCPSTATRYPGERSVRRSKPVASSNAAATACQALREIGCVVAGKKAGELGWALTVGESGAPGAPRYSPEMTVAPDGRKPCNSPRPTGTYTSPHGSTAGVTAESVRNAGASGTVSGALRPPVTTADVVRPPSADTTRPATVMFVMMIRVPGTIGPSGTLKRSSTASAPATKDTEHGKGGASGGAVERRA